MCAGKCPVLWVRLDAGGDWLADMRVLQSESMWAGQLESSKDVAAQVCLPPSPPIALPYPGSLFPRRISPPLFLSPLFTPATSSQHHYHHCDSRLNTQAPFNVCTSRLWA